MVGIPVAILVSVLVFEASDLPFSQRSSFFHVKDFKSANSHKDRGCAGHNPRDSHRFSCRRCQKISKVPTVTGMVGVLITILLAVTIVDVANVEKANPDKLGGCPTHDPRIVVAFDVADPQTANNHRDDPV